MARRKTLTKTRSDALAVRSDGWENALSGINDLNRDPRRQAMHSARLMGYDEARTLYRGDFMAANVCDRPAGDMTRKGFEPRIADDKDGSELLGNELKRLKVKHRTKDAIRWSRAYGGAGILVGVNDGVDLAHMVDPVNENAIRSIDYLTALDARELQVVRYHNNPLDPKFGEPEIYRINPWVLGSASIGLIEVHESRILRFSQPITARVDLIHNFGWGDSVLARMYEILRDFGLSWSGAMALLQDFAIALYKIRGLKDAIASDRAQLVVDRMKLIDMSKSVLRGVMLDAEGEDFERKSTTLAGLPEVLDRICNLMASAARMPVSLLFGQAPAGLNATGAADRDFYFDEIEAQQTEFIQDQMLYLCRLLALARKGPLGGRKLTDDLSIKFHPLRQQSALEKAQTRQAIAAADAVYLTNAVVTPEEVAESRFGGDEFGLDLHLDADAREAFEKVDPTDPAAIANTPRLPAGAPGEDNAPAAPPAPGLDPSASSADKAQDTALNGAQVQSAQAIVEAVAGGKLPRDSGVAMLVHFFRLQPNAADEIMGKVGNGFEPKEDPAPVVTPGGFGAKPPANVPGKPPAPAKEPKP